nr:ribonuclease H-like domain, reverse transcriptase, RNA-dependent DNA polymerase [Tanacetum cinerariifolium]
MVQEDVEPTLLMAVQEKRDKGEKIFLNEKEIKHKKYISTDESLWFQEMHIRTRIRKDSMLLVGVYVDDLIVTRSSKEDIQKFKSQMEERFEMSDLSLLSYYLGIKVTQTEGGISIKQTGYANKILKEARMVD